MNFKWNYYFSTLLTLSAMYFVYYLKRCVFVEKNNTVKAFKAILLY